MNDKANKNDVVMPEGLAFFSYAFQRQSKCESMSVSQITKLADGVPETFEKLGTVLSLLDRFASCYWGCHGLEHAIEFLAGRAVSYGIAALRLVNFGHYDEALALTRSIGEIGNLLQLFMVDPSAIRRWLDASNYKEREEFEPKYVREALKYISSIVPTDDERYGLLCATAIHPNPKVAPQAHNENSIPTLGGYYQERGQVVCINEIAWAVATVAGPAGRIAVIAPDKSQEIVAAAISLVKTLGETTLDNKQTLSQYIERTSSSDDLLSLTQFLDQTRRKPQ